MIQQLKAHTVLAEDLSSAPRTHSGQFIPAPRDLVFLYRFCRHLYSYVYIHTCVHIPAVGMNL